MDETQNYPVVPLQAGYFYLCPAIGCRHAKVPFVSKVNAMRHVREDHAPEEIRAGLAAFNDF